MHITNVIMRLKVQSQHNWALFFYTKTSQIHRLIMKIGTKRNKTREDFRSYQLEPYFSGAT